MRSIFSVANVIRNGSVTLLASSLAFSGFASAEDAGSARDDKLKKLL